MVLRITLLMAGLALPVSASALEPTNFSDKPSATFEQGVDAGRAAARQKNVNAWQFAGFGAGLVCGPVGCADTWTYSRYKYKPVNLPEASVMGHDWLLGYEDGFNREIHRRRSKKALKGGIYGSIVLGAVLGTLALVYGPGLLQR